MRLNDKSFMTQTLFCFESPDHRTFWLLCDAIKRFIPSPTFRVQVKIAFFMVLFGFHKYTSNIFSHDKLTGLTYNMQKNP